MTDASCTLKDVNQAAEELIALGCKVSATHINDGAARLSFLAHVTAFVDEVIKDIEDGLISAKEGLDTFWEEHQALAAFYGRNIVGIAAGAMQVELGAVVIGASVGAATPIGGLLISHGVNNIYEGFGNIYNGPDTEGTRGPTRWMYQQIAGNARDGNIAYGAMDLSLSAYSVFKLTRKTGSLQLFKLDPINYEYAYRQAGRTALITEGLADTSTVFSIIEERDKK